MITDNRGDMIEIQDIDIEINTINNMTHNMKKREDSDIEMDMNDNMIENTRSNTTVITNNTVFSSDEEDLFLPDPNIIPPTPVRQTSSQNTSPDVQITKMTPAKSFTFNPLTFQSREEIGIRVLITHFKSIPF